MLKSCSRSTLPALAAAACLLLAGAAGAVDTAPYHTFSEVEGQLQQWAADHPGLIELSSFGESAGGRALHVVRIAGDGPVAPDERPALFVGANIAGFHNAGSEAALDLIATLAAGAGGEHAELLRDHTFYVAPALNPDAHDELFASLRRQRGGADGRLDRDRDGLTAEDGADDLDGDGRLTAMRIADPTGGWLPHPDEPRLMVEANAEKGWIGAFRLESEGADDDRDGSYNEDGPDGVHPDMSFPHGHPYPDPEAGPWPVYAPEAKSLIEYLLARRNVAAVVVYGPANNLLEAPRPVVAGGDLGNQTITIPEFFAGFLGIEAGTEMTLDALWDQIKNRPPFSTGGITKDQIASFLGVGPATKVADEDQAVLDRLAKAYKERLKEAGLSADRPVEQYGKGGFTPWAYFQYAVPALELDVWGVPKPEKKKEEGEEEGDALTVERLEEMSSEELLALSDEVITAFLEEIGAPAQFTVEAVRSRVESGQVTPAQMAGMAKQMAASGGGGGGGGGGDDGEDDPATKRRRDVLAWIDQHAPDAVSPWTEVTLPDGTAVGVGGIDPLIEIAPPYEHLKPALAVHTATVLDLAGRLADLEIAAVEVESLGGDLYRLRAVAANRGELDTHSRQGERAKTHLPVRLGLQLGDGVERLAGPAGGVNTERLAGRTGTLEGSWLLRAAGGSAVTVELTSDNAGGDSRRIDLTEGGN